MQVTTGKRIAAARKAKGLTQIDLATALGVSQAVVSKWERNDPEVHIRWLRLIAPLCDVSISELVDVDVPA